MICTSCCEPRLFQISVVKVSMSGMLDSGQRTKNTKRGLPLALTCGNPLAGRDGGIRTHDPLTPSQVRYQAALRPGHPVGCAHSLPHGSRGDHDPLLEDVVAGHGLCGADQDLQCRLRSPRCTRRWSWSPRPRRAGVPRSRRSGCARRGTRTSAARAFELLVGQPVREVPASRRPRSFRWAGRRPQRPRR
jgi:hypothetical protein